MPEPLRRRVSLTRRLPFGTILCTLSLLGILHYGITGEGGHVHLDALAIVRSALADRYAVEEEIGRGGMAYVWRARDLRHERDVAIKLLFPELARAVGGDRFLREIRILARLSHPNILPLLDSGTVEIMPGLLVPWYVMPYVAEETLRGKLTREGPLPVPVALRYTRELCSALAHAHAQGYIHRDIKPENILLRGDQAVLADFGIARAVTVASGAALSSTGLVVGTPAYMSPEQSLGSEKLDARSDIYSLGVVLYEMLAGHPPFTGHTPQALSARHQFDPPPPIGTVRPGLPSGVEALVAKALAKVPADRYQGAEELGKVTAQAQLSEELAGAELTVRRPQTVNPRTGWRRGGRAIAAAVLGVIGAGAAIALLVGGSSIDPERVVVLPFTTAGGASSALISGGDVQTLIYDALSSFQDLARVDRFTLQNSIEKSGTPATLGEAIRATRAVGAGKLIWGEIYRIGDSVRVHAMLYSVSRWGYALRAERRAGLPLVGDTAGSQLATEMFRRVNGIVTGLLAPGGSTSGADEVEAGTTVYAALKAKSDGDSALSEWNLELARKNYHEALRLDPRYADASLEYAQLGQWLEDPATDWRPYAAAVVERRDAVSPHSRERALALVALADSNLPSACQYYRGMIQRDSSDFVGWFGLGDCQRMDTAVLPDSKSPSGYRFRSSLSGAGKAYVHALRAIPLSHRAAEQVLLPKLLEVFPTSTWLRRGTLSTDRSRVFLAWPAPSGDTTAYIPIPYAEFTGPAPPPRPADISMALDKHRALLRDLVGDWVTQFPLSPQAWQARGTILEGFERIQGDSAGALGAIKRALALDPDSVLLLPLLIARTRLELKAGQFDSAGITARRALKGWPEADGAIALSLAPLAALTGQTERCVALLRRGASAWTFTAADGTQLAPPPALAEDALAYYGYAVMGHHADSIRALERRVLRGIDGWAPVQLRNQAILGLTEDPAMFAFYDIGRGAAHGVPGHSTVLDVQIALDRGDSSAAHRIALGQASWADSVDAGELAPESVYQAAWVLLQVRDTMRAIRLLDRFLGSLSMQDHLLYRPQASAFFRRNIHLRLQLPGDPVAGKSREMLRLEDQ